MTTQAYPINVFWSTEDEAWVADAPDLPYCSALGDTPHEAVAELEVAIEAWVEAATSSGRVVAQPSVRIAQALQLPARLASFRSGRVVKRDRTGGDRAPLLIVSPKVHRVHRRVADDDRKAEATIA